MGFSFLVPIFGILIVLVPIIGLTTVLTLRFGLKPFLETLATNQALQRNLLDAERQLIEFRIELCRALAGGWEMPRPEPMSASSVPPRASARW